LTRRPVIGVSTSRGRGRIVWWFLRFATRRAGGAPVRLKPGDAHDFAALDGVIVGGGDDIAATIYGGALDPAVRVDPERDRLELALLEHAFAQGLPVLGICRGAQMINVVRGGSLHDDIHTVYAEAPRQRTVLPQKSVRVETESRLGAILGGPAWRVNALHHQSVDRLGDGLRVVARDDHGMVQAIEDADARFVIGVQWHPEFLIFDRGQRRLFERLVEAARLRSAEPIARLRQAPTHP